MIIFLVDYSDMINEINIPEGKMNQSQINTISHVRPLALCIWLRIVNIIKQK